MTEASAPAISVVIPTLQRRASLERLLRALTEQTLPVASYEVIVAMDGSDDGSREMLEGYTAPYRLRWTWHATRGRAATCNAGLAQALGRLVLFLDDDMEPSPRCLEAHRSAHGDDPRLGVVGAAPVVHDASSDAVVQYIGRKFERHLAKLARPGHEFALRDFYSGNFSVGRELLLGVGGFDEEFRLYGNEDLELSLRLGRAGVRLIFSAEALAHQHYAKDLAGLARDNFAKGRTALQLARKHPETLPHLKLGDPDTGSALKRTARDTLLVLTRLWPGLPPALIRVHGPSGRLARAAAGSRLRAAAGLLLLAGGPGRVGSRRIAVRGRGASRQRAAMRHTVVHYSDSATFGGAEQALLHLVGRPGSSAVGAGAVPPRRRRHRSVAGGCIRRWCAAASRSADASDAWGRADSGVRASDSGRAAGDLSRPSDLAARLQVRAGRGEPGTGAARGGHRAPLYAAQTDSGCRAPASDRPGSGRSGHRRVRGGGDAVPAAADVFGDPGPGDPQCDPAAAR